MNQFSKLWFQFEINLLSAAVNNRKWVIDGITIIFKVSSRLSKNIPGCIQLCDHGGIRLQSMALCNLNTIYAIFLCKIFCEISNMSLKLFAMLLCWNENESKIIRIIGLMVAEMSLVSTTHIHGSHHTLMFTRRFLNFS